VFFSAAAAAADFLYLFALLFLVVCDVSVLLVASFELHVMTSLRSDLLCTVRDIKRR